MSRSQRTKGTRGELEVAVLVQSAGWPTASRNFASGARGHSDIAHGPAATVIEVKRAERTCLKEWWRQVQADADQCGPGTLPVLAHRWNDGPWLAVLPLDELLALLALREQA